MLPVVLHTLALIICLCVQQTGSPLAGAWLFFHLIGCATLLYQRHYTDPRPAVWYGCAIWLVAISASTFLFNPVANGASFLWIFLAPVSLALCLQKQDIPRYLKAFGGVIAVYSVGLWVQWWLRVQYTYFNDPERRYSWPLMDPNNGAAAVNMLLIPLVWMTLNRNPRWALAIPPIAMGLWVTGSKAGMCTFLLCTAIALINRYGWHMLALQAACLPSAIGALWYYRPGTLLHMLNCFKDRYPIWSRAWAMLQDHPWRGVGIGRFVAWQQEMERAAHMKYPLWWWYAHNDVLQLAGEVGVPVTLTFVGLLVTVPLTTCKATLPAALVVLATMLQAMVEFQFYVPAVSYAFGLALAYHVVYTPMRGSYLSPSWIRPARSPLPRRVGRERRCALSGNSFHQP